MKFFQRLFLSFLILSSFSSVLFSQSKTIVGLPERACIEDDNYWVQGMYPGGKDFSGPGMVRWLLWWYFDPNLAGLGTHVITYDPGSSNPVTDTVIVFDLSSTSLAPFPSVCSDVSPFVLSGGEPTGGTYSGTGVDASGFFNPSIAGPGVHTITYTVEAGNCTGTATQNITVYASPVVTLSNFSPVCSGEAAFALTGGNPAGGTYSGTGVSGGFFNPSVSGTGSFPVTYTYSTGSCSNSATKNLVVNPLPVVSISGLNTKYCISDASVIITGIPTDFRGSFSGNGISDNGNGTAVFNPLSAGTGTHTITYSYTDANSCHKSVSQVVQVGTPVTITGLNLSYCQNITEVPIAGNPLGGSFTAIAGLTDNGDGTAVFNPSLAGAGTYTIQYTYGDVTGCSNVVSSGVVVNPLPTPAIVGLSAEYCKNNSAVLISANYPGGSFSGSAVTDNGDGTANFFPSSLPAGGPYAISYSYTNAATGCSNSVTKSTSINSVPLATISGSATICEGNSTPIQIALAGVSPFNFSYSNGTTVSHVNGYVPNNYSADVTPSSSVTYTVNSVTDAKGCTGSGTGSAVIQFNPQVTITSQPVSHLACPGSNTNFTVTASGVELTYQWKKNGVDMPGKTNPILDLNNVAAADAATYSCVVSSTCGGPVTSNNAVLTLAVPTVISGQPSSAYLCEGNNLNLSVTATGSNLTYQWKKNGSILADGGNRSGATNSNFSITGVSAADAGNYTCVISGSCGVIESNAAEIRIDEQINITSQPVNVSACPPGNISFSVTATGSNLLYQWQKDGSDLPGENSQSIVINGVNAANAGSYRCIISSPCGQSTISSPAILSVNQSTVINAHPVTATVCSGGNVNFSISATGSGLAYQWKKDGVNLVNGGAISGTTSDKLIITGATTMLNGIYTCEVTGTCGTLSSNPAVLTVDDAIVITQQPQNVTACQGDNINFTLTANGSNLTYQWQKNGVDMAGKINASLNLNSITAAEVADYRCLIRNSCGAELISNVAKLNVSTATVILTEPEGAVKCPGNNISFEVSATGTNLSYQWKKDGVVLVDGPRILGSATNSLFISGLVAGDAANYLCTVTGSCGTLNSNPALLVIDDDISIVSQPSGTSACVGDNVSFSVLATGSNLTYQWQKNNVNMPGETSQTLTMNSVNAASAAVYRCIIRNSCGASVISNVCSLLINESTAILTHPSDVSTCTASNISFSVSATGTNLVYQWKKNGVNLINGGNISGTGTDKLIINAVGAADAGVYSCEVSGSCGSINSNPAGLTIKENVTVTGQPVNKTVCAGNNTSFSVVASGTNLQYQWQKNGVNLPGQTAAGLILSNVSGADAGVYRCIVTGDCNTITSNGASLTVNEGLNITAQPSDVEICSGANAGFSISASGAVSCRWRLNGTDLSDGGNISGSSTADLSITSASSADAGIYTCMVTGLCGTAVSNPASLVTNENVSITTHPQNISLCPGNNAGFTVVASGTGITYQWQKNGLDIPGETNPGLIVSNVAAGDAGVYRCIVSGICGIVTSNAALLTVLEAPAVNIQPLDKTVCSGGSVAFVTGASGSNLTYQWRLNGSDLVNNAKVSGAASSTLSINPAASTDAGIITCLITGSCGSVMSNAAGLVVNSNTAITAHPQNQQVCPGGNVGFSVLATGSDLSYQWQKDGVNIVGETHAGLIITNVDATDAGVYRCIVSGSCGTQISNGALLTISTNILITQQPADVELCSGGNAGFMVNISGPVQAYRWKHNGVELSDGGIISGTQTGSLSLNSVSALNAGTYTCEISGICGTINSDPAILKVNENTIITGHPQGITVCPGNNANFSVSATGSSLSYQWQKNGSDIAGQTGTNLILPNVSAADAGTYRCLVTGACGQQISNGALLTITSEISITTQPVAVVNVCEGNNLNLKVIATGNALTYQWVKNGQNLSNGGRISGATTDNLIINGLTPDDDGIYNCRITGSCGFVNSNFSTVTVYPTTMVIQQPIQFTVTEGGNATFSVLAEGNNLVYQWEKDGSALSDGGRISGATTPLLTISGTGETDEGAYRCIISGTCNNINSNPAGLTVNSTSIITSQPAGLIKCEGESAGFSVVATGTALTYQWKKNGIDLSDNANISGSTTFNLTIHSVSEADAGAYTCMTGGEISSPALLTVNRNTLVTTHPVSSVLCNGDIATFSVEATGSALSFQWQKNGVNLTDGGNISGSLSKVLHLSNVSDADEGTYRCVVTGSCGTANSNPATLIINNVTSITQQPGNQTVCEGESVLLSVTASGDGLSYQWKKDGVNLSDGGNITGSGTPSLILSNTTLANSGNYTCTITGSCGSENSLIAKVKVQGPVVIINQPVSISACEGDHATFTVSASGAGLIYQWQKDGVDLSDGASVSGALTPVLSIAGMTSPDVGAYRCVVTGSCGSAISDVALLNSSVHTTILTQPASSSLCEGQPLSVNISVTGSQVNYQWKKDGTNLVNGGTISGVNTANLIISNATLNNSGFYSCLVTGVCGSENSTLAEVTVDPSTTISVQPENESYCTGDFAGMAVLASGSNVTYQWKKDGVNLSDGGTVSGSNTNLLMINGMGTADAGAYTCLVNGTCNSVYSDPAVIQVSEKTVITSHPAGKTVCEGEPAILQVTAGGNNLIYQWKKDGIPLTDGGNISGSATANLSITNTTINNSGAYTCSVTGSCGSVNSDIAVLTVHESPEISHHPVSISRCSGDNAAFMISATGTGLSYQWQKNGADVSDDARISGSNTGLLSISSITAANNGTYRCVVTGTCGSASSDPALLNTYLQTIITLQPAEDSVCEGESAVMRVTAQGNNLIYKWKKDGINLIDGSNISGSASSVLSVTNAVTANNGIYTCEITGTCGNVNSSPARLVVNRNTVIQSHPLPLTKCKGDIAVFSVTATGQDLSYQWEKDGGLLTDGVNIFGSSTPVLTVNNTDVSDQGSYRCIVTGKCGESFSDPADLVVNVYPADAGFITGPADVCQGDTAVIYEVQAIANANRYEWSVPVGVTITSGWNTRLIKVSFAHAETGGIISVRGVNECGYGTVSPVFTVLANPIPSSFAGEDKNICAAEAILDGNNPGTGNGEWNVINGPALVQNTNLYNSPVNNLRQGENILTWTVTRDGCSTVDTVRIYNNTVTVDAGPNQTVCLVNTTLDGTAVPSGAVGSWSVVTGSATFSNGNLNNTTAGNFAPGMNKLKWTITKAGCINFDTVMIDNQRPSDSYAGIDQLLCRDTSNLSASNPLIGTGKWSVVTGTAVFSDDTKYNTRITGIGQGDNIFRWTVTNGICSSMDEVSVSNNKVSADAGIDQVICDRTATLSAVQPTVGTGNWSVITGAGIFMDINQYDTKVTGLKKGDNVLRWTVNKNNCLSSDTVVIVNDSPTQSYAGEDQVIMTDYATLQGVIPEVGTGEWTLISGSAVFANPSQFNTTVSGLNSGVNTFRWTITHNSCSSSDDVDVTNYTPNTTNAGNDQTLCQDYTNLNGNEPVFGFGEWSVIRGSAMFVNNSDPKTRVTGLSRGENVLRWTVWENGYTSDDVVIINNSPTLAEAGFNQVLCADSAGLFANSPYYGSGVWSVTGGSATFVDSSKYNTKVKNLAPGLNHLKWTITNQGCVSSDIVTIHNDMPTTATAGVDQTICTGTATLTPNTPTVGTGRWSIISGSGIFTGNVVSNLAKDHNTLRWTISTTTCSSFDDIVITNNKPSNALAGADKIICYDSLTLAANTPVTGTGLWTTQNGSAVFQSLTSGNSRITGIAKGQNVFRWTITYNGCSSYDEVVIENAMTSAWTGQDQILCGSSTILQANNPEQGVGSWSVVGGSGSAIFDNIGQPDTRVSGLDQGENILRWTIQNSICSSYSDIMITNNMPSAANAGPDQALCTNFTTLKGNTPAIGTGSWSVLGGSGDIEFPDKPDSKVSNLKNGVNTLRWTITNQGCTSSDEAVISNDSPTLSSAGEDQKLCSDSAVLYGSNPVYGTGSWSIVSGSALFENNTSYNTRVSRLGKGTNILRWTVTNKNCKSTDEVSIINNIPSQAVAGSDQTICGDVTMVNANIPLIGTGEWLLISGSAVFGDSYSGSTFVSALNPGENIIRWNITNAGCTTFDDLVINNDLPVVADAGPDMEICSSSTPLFANNPLGGTGKWEIVSGSASFNDPFDYNATVSGLGFGINTLSWTIQFGQCITYDEIVIINDKTDIYAGIDQTTGRSQTMLAANNPAVGTGTWSVTGGAGYFANPSDFLTAVTNLGPGKNTFRWSVDINGCVSFDEVTVTYNVPPVASFVADKYEGCPPLEVYFVNNSLDNLPFIWNFGDGTTSSDITTSHIFDEPGRYKVVLTVTGNAGEQISKDTTIFVYDQPVADFEMASDEVFIPDQPAIFINKSEYAQTYLWDFGDTTTSEERDPWHNYQYEGNYDVNLTVWSDRMCTDSITIPSVAHIVESGTIRFPNAFSPNLDGPTGGNYSPGDLSNDVFYPIGDGIAGYHLEVFNKWGILIFESSDIHIGWDGYYNGELLKEGVYIWKITGTYNNGKKFNKIGTVMLVH